MRFPIQIGYLLYLCVALLSFLLGYPLFADEQNESKRQTQQTLGNQSPAIIANGNVTIIYKGISNAERELYFKQLGNQQLLIDRLLKENGALKEDLKVSRDETELWVKKYYDLKRGIQKIKGSSDQVKKDRAEAKTAIINGDLNKASGIILRYSPDAPPMTYSPKAPPLVFVPPKK